MPAFLLSLAGGGFNIVKAILSGLGRFFGSLDAQGWAGLVVAFLAAFFGLHEAVEARHWHKQSVRYEALYSNEKSAFDTTVANYRTAAAKQKADDDAKNAHAVSQQQAINKEQSDEYQTRIAAAVAERDRLRASAAHSGGRPGTGVPGLSPPSARPDEAAGQNGLSLDDAFLCTAQSIQLDELEKWARAQHSVDPNASPKP